MQLQDERERGEKEKRQEYRSEHVLRMRAQKPNKSGHEYECNHTIEYTTFLPSDLLVNTSRDRQKENHDVTRQAKGEDKNVTSSFEQPVSDPSVGIGVQ